MTIEDIAKIAYTAVATADNLDSEYDSVPWDFLSEDDQEYECWRVTELLISKFDYAGIFHDIWLGEMLGYGRVEDNMKEYMVPFEYLPLEMQMADRLFCSIVWTLRDCVEFEDEG